MTPEVKSFMDSLPQPTSKPAGPPTADEWESSRAAYTEEWSEVLTQTASAADTSDADSRRMSASEFRQYLKRRHALHAAADDRPELPVLPAAEPPTRSARQRVRRTPSAAPDPVLKADWAPAVGTPNSNTGCAATPDAWIKDCFILQHHLRVSFPIAPDGHLGPEVKPGEEHQFELEYPNVVKVRDLVTGALRIQPDQLLTWSRWFYKSGFKWGGEPTVASLHYGESLGHATLDIRGGGCDSLLAQQLLNLCRALKAAVPQMTGLRIDCAFDDYNRIASMDEIQRARAALDFKGFKKSLSIRPDNMGTLEGDSVTFGTRTCKSGKYMRIYDKFLETGGDNNFDCIRYESELSEEKAALAFEEICACQSVEEYAQVLGSWVEGVIDFVKREGYERNIQRAPRLEWWEKITALLAAKVRESVPRLVPPLMSAAKAHFRQWGAHLALLRIGLQSLPKPVNIGAVIENICDHFEEKINWAKQQGRDLGVSLSMLLEGPHRAALAAQEV